jgi:hypothetical protein
MRVRGRKHHLHVWKLKVLGYLEFFLCSKFRFLQIFLLDDPLLRVAEVEKGRGEFGVWDGGELFELGEKELIVFVEEEEDDGLVGVHYEEVGFGGVEKGFEFD